MHYTRYQLKLVTLLRAIPLSKIWRFILCLCFCCFVYTAAFLFFPPRRIFILPPGFLESLGITSKYTSHTTHNHQRIVILNFLILNKAEYIFNLKWIWTKTRGKVFFFTTYSVQSLSKCISRIPAPKATLWTMDGNVNIPLDGVAVDDVKTTIFERRFNPYDFNGGYILFWLRSHHQFRIMCIF